MNKKPRILLVDTEVERRTELVRVLQDRFDSEVLVAETLSAAREKIEAAAPDLVISSSLLDDSELLRLSTAGQHAETPAFIRLTEADDPVPAPATSIRTLELVRGSEESLNELQQAIQQTLKLDSIPRNRYELLFNSVSDTVTVTQFENLERPGRFLEVNESACRILGYSREELLSKSPTDFWERATESDFAGVANQLAESGEAQFERVLLTKTGERRVIEAHSRLIDFEGQRAVLTVARDVTEKRAAGLALEESEQKYKLLFESAGVGIGYWSVDGILKSFNRAALEHLGDASIDFSGRSAADIFGEEMGVKVMERIAEVISTGSSLEFGDVVTMPTGRKWFRSIYSAVANEEEILGIQIVSHDVTAEMLAKEALRESEANLQTLFESTEDLIASRDLEGRLIVFNRAFAELLKKLHGIEARPGLVTTDYLPHSKKSHWEKVLARVVAGENYREEFSWNFDGELRHYEISLNPIVAEGKTIGTTEFTRDITKRTETEAELQASRHKLEVFLHSSSHCCAILDQELRILDCNKAWAALMGKTPEESIGLGLVSVSPTAGQTGRAAAYQTVIETGEPLHLSRVQIPGKRGDMFFEVNAFKVGDGLGLTLIDITDQVIAEENLKQVHVALQEEHRALEEKNITLREVLNQIQEREKQVATQAQANIDKVVIPTLMQLERRVPVALRQSVARIQHDLQRVFSPLVSELERQYAQLSPREVSICNMIRAGLSTKEIAAELGTSVETVRSQRKQVRRKLGISGRKVNLSSYLASLAKGEAGTSEFND